MKLTPFSVTLKNGTSVFIREVTQQDRHLLQIGFEHLSDQSKYFQFLAARRNLTTAELDKFTAPNDPDHVAVGALVEGSAIPEPVGIARYIRLFDQNHVAEIAITITDDYHHQGLGIILLGVLAKFARLDGITEFSALVHKENTAMRGLLGQLGGTQVALGGAEIEVNFPISAISDLQFPTSIGGTFDDV